MSRWIVDLYKIQEKKVRAAKGKSWQDFSLAELDAFWDQAKDFERNR